MRRIGVALALVLALGGATGEARADAVDDAFAAGNDAAARRDWDRAVEAYEQASSVFPGRSALLSYDLGTAYAHLGDLGRATYHLRRAMDWRGGPTAAVLEAARDNAGVVRRRVEMEAVQAGRLVDRPETWWDLVVEALGAQGVAWVSLVSGIAFLVTLLMYRRSVRAGRSTGRRGAAVIVLAICTLLTGPLHAWVIRADSTSPVAIVLDSHVEARDGPSAHRDAQFELQGGAKIRIVGRSPGWRRVRMPGGVEGWVPEHTVAPIESSRAVPGKHARP